MSSKLSIFLTGATGYIGGSILNRLLTHPAFPSFHITALVRTADAAKKLEKLGIIAVVGSHTDDVLVERLVSEAEYVFTAADVDSLPAAKAVLKGAKKRFDTVGKPTVLIHTSGTAVLGDTAEGDRTSDVIYDDLKPDQINQLPESQPHRNVDLALINADNEGYVHVYFIVPSTIYGVAEGKLVDEGIQNPRSQQIPILIRAALDRGQAGMVGTGLNYWPNVHIKDVTELYITVFDAIRRSPTKVPHGRNGYFFGANGEHQLVEVSRAIGEALVALGLAKDRTPTTFNKEEISKYLGGTTGLGTNSRCKANHGKLFGWEPKHTKADFITFVKLEVKDIAQEKGLLKEIPPGWAQEGYGSFGEPK